MPDQVGTHECGLTQAGIENRVADCSRLPGSSRLTIHDERVDLVARACPYAKNRCYEVWKDAATGLLWSDTLDGSFTHYQAIERDDEGKIVSETACESQAAALATAGIEEVKFRLPTQDEQESSLVQSLLPNQNCFWNSDLAHDRTRNDAWASCGYADRGRSHKVKCVAESIAK